MHKILGLLALLLTNSRREARVSKGGDLVLLADQDHSRWIRSLLDEVKQSCDGAYASIGRDVSVAGGHQRRTQCGRFCRRDGLEASCTISPFQAGPIPLLPSIVRLPFQKSEVAMWRCASSVREPICHDA